MSLLWRTKKLEVESILIYGQKKLKSEENKYITNCDGMDYFYERKNYIENL